MHALHNCNASAHNIRGLSCTSLGHFRKFELCEPWPFLLVSLTHAGGKHPPPELDSIMDLGHQRDLRWARGVPWAESHQDGLCKRQQELDIHCSELEKIRGQGSNAPTPG